MLCFSLATCQASASALRYCGGVRRPERGVYEIYRGRRSSCHGRWRRCILVCHGQSEDCCMPLQILHDLETDEDVSPLATQQCGFVVCVLDNQQNMHRASCGFGTRTVAALLSVNGNSHVDSQRFEPSRN